MFYQTLYILGEALLCEYPYTIRLEMESQVTHCAHCLKPCYSLKPCFGCRQVSRLAKRHILFRINYLGVDWTFINYFSSSPTTPCVYVGVLAYVMWC